MKSPILRAKLHAPLATGERWLDHAEILSNEGISTTLLPGEDALPLCEVIEYGEDCRLLLLAVADGVGGGHIDRYYKVIHPDGGEYVVTDMRLAAELALSNLKNELQTLGVDQIKTNEGDQRRNIEMAIRRGWDTGAHVLSQARPVHGGRVYVQEPDWHILGSTTFTSLCYVETPDQRSIHCFKVGDSPFLIQLGSKVYVSKDTLNQSNVLDGSLRFLRGKSASFIYQTYLTKDLNSFTFPIEEAGPITLAAFSDAHVFDDLDSVRSNWGAFFQAHHDSDAELESALTDRIKAGSRGGSDGDDFSMALARINSGEKSPASLNWELLHGL